MSKSRNKKWRHVYPYTCAGCGRRRIAFVYERAHKGICTRCEKPEVDKDQGKLFGDEKGEASSECMDAPRSPEGTTAIES